ncbi:MAG: tetratricopeptide repeat protein [Halobacteria archaeon]|nr:tetratricopeptide repeat protein [Halobacteria archaeon]
MDDPVHKILKISALLIGAVFISWMIWDGLQEQVPGEKAYEAANRYFEDGYYQQAIAHYEAALQEDPQLLPAMRGKARSLMQMGQYQEALKIFNEVIYRQADFAPSYANRGILHDRMGHYREAIADYEKSLELDAEMVEGPNWLTRFLRLQAEKPPTVADRAAYLRQELAKPESERLLRLPEEDEKQRSYKK